MISDVECALCSLKRVALQVPWQVNPELPQVPHPQLDFLDILIFQVLATSNLCFLTQMRPWRFYHMQSLPVVSDFIFSPQPSYLHLVPSSLVWTRLSPTYSFGIHYSPCLRTLPVTAALGGILPCQSQICCAFPCHRSSQYHLLSRSPLAPGDYLHWLVDLFMILLFRKRI